MSTGKRLAKRSIIGTRVCAPGDDGKYYSGFISAVDTPAHAQHIENGININPATRYSIRFDPLPTGIKPPNFKGQFMDKELIGPGFRQIPTVRLVPGQKVFLTYNGREIQAEVTQHRFPEEVDVVFVPSGQEGTTMNLTKRIEEVRLLESRKSARLADTDTDFARLADMGSDRKRASSHSIEVPQVYGSRKRRPSSSNDSDRSYNGERSSSASNQQNSREAYMDECSAAMVLMSLSTPPKNPLPLHCQQSYGSWDGTNGVAVGSPGVGGTSNSSSSSASWRSGTPSPPLSDEGALSSSNNSGVWQNGSSNVHLSLHHHNYHHQQQPSQQPQAHNQPQQYSSHQHHHHHHQHQQQQQQQQQQVYHQRVGGSSSSSPNFTYDEGIVPDLDLERPRKKKIRCKADNEDDDYRSSPPSTSSPPAHSSPAGSTGGSPPNAVRTSLSDMPPNGRPSSPLTNDGDSDNHKDISKISKPHQRHKENVKIPLVSGNRATRITKRGRKAKKKPLKTPGAITIYKCTWRDNRNVRCTEVGQTWETLAAHVLQEHLGGKKTYPNEEDFHIVDEQIAAPACSPPTKSHWDMVRPRTEDPEYQRQMRLATSPEQNNQEMPAQVNSQDILIRDVYSMAAPQSTTKPQFKPAPRPLQAYNTPNISVVTVSLGKMPHSPRRVRGDTKKCRKVYGMERKDFWCTQCKWKKACTRFCD